ncbi:MAG: Crp/Fnr family transcriptional regulator [Elusimicrobia bacterium]|nr:Crp/Fnr family transcriptional regulator [Elusimicrobiota bacterium]
MIRRTLRKVCFFRTLTPGEIDQLLSISRLARYQGGDPVFMKEDIGDNFFIVKSGRIKIYTTVGGGKKKTFAFLKKGDFFGEMSLLGGKVRSASAQAVEESELIVISKKNFRALILQAPDFTLKLLYTLADRLNKCDKEIESMLFHNILGRLADAVLEMAKDKRARPVKIQVGQRDLAEYLGTTRVPVCRAISSLRRSGVIDYKRGELTVLNMDRLRSISGNSAPYPGRAPAHVHGKF